MSGCQRVHHEYDKYANKDVQLGDLPSWMHVSGRVAWYVSQGPYNKLPEAWAKFGERLRAIGSEKLAGPPGDVYVCDPMDHKGAAEKKMITVLWAPLKD